jgi:hypothetical protein
MSAQPVELDAPAPALRLLPAPVSEPAVAPGPAAGPAPATATRSVRRPVPLAPAEEDVDDLDPVPARRRTSTGDLPEPRRWAAQFVQAAVEVAVGLRPAVQLVRWTQESVYSTLARRSDVAARARRAGRLAVPVGRARVRSVRCCPVRDGVVEASAVVTDGVRHRGVALRLEGIDGRWQVTALELG